LEKDLSAILAMKVAINHKAGTETGQVVLTYENLDQLDDLCAKLSR
jgi:ParB family chromosome partitioning protein